MKKACGTQLALYLLIAAAIGGLVYRRFPKEESAIAAAVIGGFFLWLGVAYFIGIGQKLKHGRMISRALEGQPPVDGEKIAAIGRISPTGSPLTSPITKSPAVAYKYDIKSGRGDDEHKHYSGYALTPSIISTQQGSIRLLAWPDLKIKENCILASDAQTNAEEYIAATEWNELSIENIRKSIAEMMDVYKDDDGSVRHDQKGRPADDLSRVSFYESVVRAGEPVCVIGKYSAARGGIIPSDSPLVDQTTLQVGEPHTFGGRTIRGAIGYFIGGVIFVGGSLAALIALYVYVPLEVAEQMSPETRFSWPEIRLEKFIESRVRTPLRHADMFPEGQLSIDVPANGATGRVRAKGREEVVTRSAAVRDGEKNTTVRIDDETVVFTIDSHRKLTTLRILGQNVSPETAELRDLSLVDQGVSGRLTYLTDSDDAAVCRVTFHTVVKEAEVIKPPEAAPPARSAPRGTAKRKRR